MMKTDITRRTFTSGLLGLAGVAALPALPALAAAAQEAKPLYQQPAWVYSHVIEIPGEFWIGGSLLCKGGYLCCTQRFIDTVAEDKDGRTRVVSRQPDGDFNASVGVYGATGPGRLLESCRLGGYTGICLGTQPGGESLIIRFPHVDWTNELAGDNLTRYDNIYIQGIDLLLYRGGNEYWSLKYQVREVLLNPLAAGLAGGANADVDAIMHRALTYMSY